MFHLQMSSAGAPGVPRVLDVGCPAGIMTCGVNERGDVMPCSFFTELTAGNVMTNGFRNVWENSPLFRELRSRDADETCHECAHSGTCGGCRARSYGMHGELHKSDPYCTTAPGAIPEPTRRPQPLILLSRRPD
jgi:radical SAM protein with 4Fe4S-binding SPASM domain